MPHAVRPRKRPAIDVLVDSEIFYGLFLDGHRLELAEWLWQMMATQQVQAWITRWCVNNIIKEFLPIEGIKGAKTLWHGIQSVAKITQTNPEIEKLASKYLQGIPFGFRNYDTAYEFASLKINGRIGAIVTLSPYKYGNFLASGIVVLSVGELYNRVCLENLTIQCIHENAQDVNLILNLHTQNLFNPNQPSSVILKKIDEIDIQKILKSNNIFKISDAYLPGVNLSGINLRGSEIRRSDLNQSDLSSSFLSYSKLLYSDFSDCFLTRSTMMHSVLWSSNFSNADFRNSNLSCADLSGSCLKNSNLSLANLQGAILNGSNLEGADLRGANLTNTEFNDANLKNTKFGQNSGIDEKKLAKYMEQGALFL
jgi:uncharacterized protein YjbI with pentapeptide repeats